MIGSSSSDLLILILKYIRPFIGKLGNKNKEQEKSTSIEIVSFLLRYLTLNYCERSVDCGIVV